MAATKLARARDEATLATREARELGHTVEDLRLDAARAWFLQATPGWSGEPCEAWRARSHSVWWHSLVMRESRTSLDWLEPWFDLSRIRREPGRWVSFWTRECGTDRLPREWLRWAMSQVRAVRTVTSGAPVDNQISTYLVDYDVFVTADRAFVDCVDMLRPHSPVPLAKTSLSPTGAAGVEHLINLIAEIAGHNSSTTPSGERLDLDARVRHTKR